MSDDVLITPASRKIEFKDSGGNVDGTIQLDSSGNLVLTSTVGLLIGDLDADIHIGDGSNTVDMVFDIAGSIYSAANQDLTIGKKSLGGNDVKIDTPAMMRITTASGYVDIGPNNSSWSHFYTDRAKYYFDKGVIVDEGIIGSYNEDLKLVTDQNETRVTIKATDGDVGIGNTDPISKLHVSGDTTIYNTTNEAHLVLRRDATGTNYGSSVRFEFGDSGSASSGHLYARMVGAIQDSTNGSEDGYLRFDTSKDGTITEQMRIDKDGNVGIGTTSPVSELDLNTGALSFAGTNTQLKLSGGSNVDLQLGHWGNTHILIDTDGNDSNRYFAVSHGNATAGSATELMRVQENGNVGIGTTSPSTALDVVGDISGERLNLEKSSGYASIEVGGGSGAFIDMKNPFSDDFDCRLITDGTGLDIIAAGSGNHITLKTNGTERFQVEDAAITFFNAYAFPNADGSANQVLKTNGSGSVTWADQSGGGGAVDSIANFANDRVLTASDADSINGEANLVFDGTNLGIGEDDPANLLEIRGASTAGTKSGHIMLTGDSATVGQGPQIVFSESGSGSSWAGASIGHVRTGSGSMGDLIFSTRQSGGDANTVPTEVLRMTGGTTPEITMATNISSSSKSAYNLMQKYYFQRSSMGTGTVDLRAPVGGDGSANPNNYPMPRAGKVVALTLHYYGGSIATGVETDVWRIRKYSGGSETTLDVDLIRQTLTNPTGTNYTKTIELASPMNVAEGDLIFIKRQTNGGSVTHVSAMLYVSFAG